MSDPTYVLAGNYVQFVNYCRSIGRSHHDPAFRYLHDERDLRGLHHRPNVIRVGTWQDRHDLRDIELLLGLLWVWDDDVRES